MIVNHDVHVARGFHRGSILRIVYAALRKVYLPVGGTERRRQGLSFTRTQDISPRPAVSAEFAGDGRRVSSGLKGDARLRHQG